MWCVYLYVCMYIYIYVYTSIKYNLRPFYSSIHIYIYKYLIYKNRLWCDVFIFFFFSINSRTAFFYYYTHTRARVSICRYCVCVCVCWWNDYGFDPYIVGRTRVGGDWYFIYFQSSSQTVARLRNITIIIIQHSFLYTYTHFCKHYNIMYTYMTTSV